jgi:hypothetical protein
MTGIGVEDTLKAITKLVLNNLSAKYRLEEGAQGQKSAVSPAPAAVHAAAPRAAAAPPPEDRALDALEATPRTERRAPLRAPGPPPEASEPEDVIELTDEVPFEGKGSAPLFELEEEPPAPPPVTLHPSAVRPAPPRPAVAASVRATAKPLPALEPDLFDQEDPIDLEEPIDGGVAAPVVLSVPSSASEKEIEVPIRLEVGGRTVEIRMRLRVRLSG